MSSIGVDIDDTLYSFNNLAREVIIDVALEDGDKRLQRGAYCAWGEWRSPSDVSDPDAWLKVIERCHSSQHIAAQVPFPGAVATLWELVDSGHDLHYISNRRPDSYQDTHDWLYAWGFPIEAPHMLSCNYDDKLAQLRDCQYLIDDRPKTLVQFVYEFYWKQKHGSAFSDHQRHGFGLYMPYNAALTDVPRIKLAPNWKLLRQYLIEQHVLQPRSTVASPS